MREERESSSREDRSRSEGGETGAMARRIDEMILVFYSRIKVIWKRASEFQTAAAPGLKGTSGRSLV